MNQEEYLNDRLNNQLSWYDKKSVVCQKRFKLVRTLEIIFAALIPLLSVINDESDTTKIIIAGLGTAIVVIAGFNAMNKYQELWIGYRTTAETLKHHKFLFETQCTPYDKQDKFSKLVENVEAIVSRENSNWNILVKKKRKA